MSNTHLRWPTVGHVGAVIVMAITLLAGIMWVDTATTVRAAGCDRTFTATMRHPAYQGFLWTDPANWTPAGVPTAADHVCVSIDGLYIVGADLHAGTLTIAPGVRVQFGGSGFTPATSTTLTLAQGGSLAGILETSPLGCCNATAATLTVRSGTLEITPTGTLQVTEFGHPDGRIPQGIRVLLDADITNAGALELTGQVTLGVGRTLVNRGRLRYGPSVAADGNTLTLTGSGSTLRNESGGSIQGENRGFDGSADGTLMLTEGATFHFAGGVIRSAAVGGAPHVVHANMSFGAGAVADGNALIVVQGSSTLAGDIPASVTVNVAAIVGDPGAATSLTAAAGFTNAGTLLLKNPAGCVPGACSPTPLLVAVTGGILTNRGVLAGSGTIGAAVRNQGTVQPGVGPGVLSIGGAYEQEGMGVLSVELGGLVAGTEYSQLAVGGNPTALAGTLRVGLVNGFMPESGQIFQVVRAAGVAGGFGSYEGLTLPGNVVLQPQLDSGGVTLRAVSTLPPSTLRVTSTADSGPGSLREALALASASPGPDAITFQLIGCPCTITLASELVAVTGTEVTITGPGAEQLRLSGNEAVRVLRVEPGARLALHGLTIAAGLTEDPDAPFGAGIYNDGGTLTLSHSVVRDNAIVGTGVGGFGGGIYNSGGTLTLLHSAVSDNEIASGGRGDGGGIYNSFGGTVTLSHSTVSGNIARIGGGIYNNTADGGALTLFDSAVRDNTAAVGGGIYNAGGGLLTLTNSTVSENDTAGVGGDGGGIFNNGGPLTLINSTISGNAAANGGGIRTGGGPVTVANSTISENVASLSGGGIYHGFGGTVTLSNSTVADNSAAGSGGGGGLFVSGGGVLALQNTIVAYSAAGGECQSAGGTVTDGGHNLVEDNSCGFTGGQDPLLGPLGDHGGPTPTHALLAGSPALEAGDDGVCGAAPVNGRDQRGVVRPQGIHCDIGAFELAVAVPKPDGPLVVKGRMRGYGRVLDPVVGRVTHQFKLHCDPARRSNTLVVWWGGGNRFRLETLTQAACTDGPAVQSRQARGFGTHSGSGTGQYNGEAGATVRWTFTDAGGRGTDDRSQITIMVGVQTVLSVDGVLSKGNHRASNHRDHTDGSRTY